MWVFGEGVHSCLGDLDGQILDGCVRVLKGRWRPIPRTGNYEGFGKPTPQLSPGQQEVRLDESILRHSAKSRTDTKARVLVRGLLEQRGNCGGHFQSASHQRPALWLFGSRLPTSRYHYITGRPHSPRFRNGAKGTTWTVGT